MDKLIKLFPLLPAEKATGQLIGLICFYLFVPSIAGGIVGFVLGLTIILAPISYLVGLAVTAYTVMGIVFSIMSYCGHKFN